MIKKFGQITLTAALILWATVANSQAKVDVYFVNHFGRPIDFTITINPQVLPELSSPFTLKAGEELRTTAVETEKQTYIYGVSDQVSKAFFGLHIIKGQPKFYYYSELENGIAFSWKNNVITFCTVDEYKKKRSC